MNRPKKDANKPKKLPEKEFLKTFKNVPRVAVNLVITDSDGKVLLTRRNITPCLGSWHFPGSFLLKNETIFEAQKRIAKNEFGLNISNTDILSILGVFEDIEGDPRGHVVDIMYGLSIKSTAEIKTTKETLEVKFFSKNNLPADIGFNHRDTLNQLGYK
jgi:ADP-ribose pyrophosphatase YjhB (NUDIX family)